MVAQESKWLIATVIAVAMLVTVIIIYAVVSNVALPISNFFELTYAQAVTQFGGAGFIPKIQISYFTDSFYPINNRVTTAQFANVLNGTYTPQLSLLQRYIASNGTGAYPITTKTPITGASLLSSFVTNPSSLTYSANPTNFPSNASLYSVYPLYLVSYTVSCSGLSSFQSSQIGSVSSPLIKYFGNVCGVLNSTKFSYQAIVGLSNKTATQIDGIYTELNPSYQIGTQNYLQPLSVFAQNGVQISTNNAINGTFLGYVASLNSSIGITTNLGTFRTIYPIRNIFSGSLSSGKILLSSLYCYNSKSLTNFLATAGYASYPYVFDYNGTNYQCLTLNATDTILNATSNLDGSNFRINPTILNGTLLTHYPYIMARQIGAADTYQYLVSGVASTVPETIVNKQFWFVPNVTNIFSIAKASPAVYTSFTAVQYLVSSIILMRGQEPNYTSIPIQSYYGSTLVTQRALIKNASTYLYGPLIGNLTYQYTFNAPQTGTPVYCPSICTYNGTIVYSQASVNSNYPYQYVNQSYGYLILPQLNQTIYYNPQIAVIAQSPLRNDTSVNNYTYGKLCLVIDQYNCLYGLSAYQTFQDSQNYTSFIIYGEGVNASFVVNGYSITGWKHMEAYLNNQINSSRLATISMFNIYGGQEWSVSGIVENVSNDYIVVSPQSYSINSGAYPEARTLSYSLIDLVLLIGLIILVVPAGYLIYSTRFKTAFEEKK